MFGWAWPTLNYKSVSKLIDLFVYANPMHSDKVYNTQDITVDYATISLYY